MKRLFFLAWLFLTAAFALAQEDFSYSFGNGEERGFNNDTVQVDAHRVQQHFSEALQIKTVSYADESQMDWNEFDRFHSFLKEAYPLVHQTLHCEHVSKASLLYTWQGSCPALDPIAILAHMDVAPIADSENGQWQYPPFSGFNDGQYIWGRGALDMKNVLICAMEAVETLLEEGYQPERTVLLCFGHNEESSIGSNNGARAIVALLKERGIHLESTIDEGGAILPVDIKGVMQKNLVGIGIAEKGYADVKITVRSEGGHSSQPPQHTASGMLAKVIRDLERHPFQPEMLTMVDDMFRIIGKNTKLPFRLLIPFMLDCQSLALILACRFPQSATFVRTTQACTMLEGSPAPNVLPQSASVMVNFRLLPGTTVNDVEEHIRKVVRNKDIDIEIVCAQETKSISPTDSKAYAVLTELSHQRDEKNIVAPYLVMGRTDSYHYEDICENVYRYSPFLVDASLLLTTHAANERCPVEQLVEGVHFYKSYIKKMTKQ